MGRKSKDYNQRELTQARNFECIVYEESEEYNFNYLLDERLNSFWDEWYYIRHDCDTYTENDVEEWKIKNNEQNCPFGVGELKKVHYHIIGHMDHPLILGLAATKFGVKSNFVQPVHKLNKCIQYLIHKNNPEKYPYQIEQIHCKSHNLMKYFQDNESSAKATMLIDFICSGECKNIVDLSRYAIENNAWDELRRGQHLFTAILKERV